MGRRVGVVPVDEESDFYAAMLAAFAFAALMGWPSCFAVDSPAVPAVLSGGYAYMGSAGYVCRETELVDGVSDFFAAMLAAIAFAALMGWPSRFAVDSQLYSLCFQGVCFALLRFQGFFVVFVCLLRCCFGLRFQMAMVGMLAALSTLWSFCLGLRF